MRVSAEGLQGLGLYVGLPSAAPDMTLAAICLGAVCRSSISAPFKASTNPIPLSPHPAPALRPASDAQTVVQHCVGFLAAWSGACWFAYCSVMLWMFRTGMMQP